MTLFLDLGALKNEMITPTIAIKIPTIIKPISNLVKYFSKISNVDEINFNSLAVNGVTRLFNTIPFVIPPANQMIEMVVKTKTLRLTKKTIYKVTRMSTTL